MKLFVKYEDLDPRLSRRFTLRLPSLGNNWITEMFIEDGGEALVKINYLDIDYLKGIEADQGAKLSFFTATGAEGSETHDQEVTDLDTLYGDNIIIKTLLDQIRPILLAPKTAATALEADVNYADGTLILYDDGTCKELKTGTWGAPLPGTPAGVYFKVTTTDAEPTWSSSDLSSGYLPFSKTLSVTTANDTDYVELAVSLSMFTNTGTEAVPVYVPNFKVAYDSAEKTGLTWTDSATTGYLKASFTPGAVVSAKELKIVHN